MYLSSSRSNAQRKVEGPWVPSQLKRSLSRVWDWHKGVAGRKGIEQNSSLIHVSCQNFRPCRHFRMVQNFRTGLCLSRKFRTVRKFRLGRWMRMRSRGGAGREILVWQSLIQNFRSGCDYCINFKILVWQMPYRPYRRRPHWWDQKIPNSFYIFSNSNFGMMTCQHKKERGWFHWFSLVISSEGAGGMAGMAFAIPIFGN